MNNSKTHQLTSAAQHYIVKIYPLNLCTLYMWQALIEGLLCTKLLLVLLRTKQVTLKMKKLFRQEAGMAALFFSVYLPLSSL